jgi:hypothetical protein
MAVTHTLPAAFSQSIGKQIALPAGAKSLFFFGSGFDGNNANRVLGGPAASSTGSPVYSSNYVTVGYNGVSNNVIDTNNPRDAAMLAAGWTWMAVAKTSYAGSNWAPIITDQNIAGAPQTGNEMGFGFLHGSNRIVAFAAGIATRSSIVLSQSIATNWHIFGYTVGAGGLIGATATIWEFTENQAGQGAPYTLTVNNTAQPAMSPHIGVTSAENALAQAPVDVAWAFVAQGVLSQAAMAALAAAVRTWLARRGIVM